MRRECKWNKKRACPEKLAHRRLCVPWRARSPCKEGPYRIVRHPGYLGGLLYTITLGLVLGSWWAAIPQAIASLLLIWRTAREDQTLQAELPGYLEFTKETRYRLIPGIW